jgi:hypothetical protein
VRYLLSTLRAFLCRIRLPRCARCHRLCVDGWIEDPHTRCAWPHYICLPCYWTRNDA